MSLQAQTQQQPQQPVQVYPTSVTNQPNSHSHHSKGSFGTVFIVLAIILVISIIACFLSRLCSRRFNKNHNHNHNHNSDRPVKQQRPPQIHNFHPRDQGDIEFGIDKRFPSTSRSNGHGGNGSSIEVTQPPSNGNMKGFEMKHVHEEEL
ncbi:hypothetical protein TanjilG_05602 [Lupinus angustifolius]|uniref:Transmembrane protein n=1 Tax=Lupinus angustifolius TaxID=3871 RepID=A0A4P1QSF7_LUPAN|nr:PREDICTED: uncharacterized protein LOC109330686 [Lupinus angustifolius]OIV93899.1 hypothetical protein TanjilG_05602 [Lupinus angustifolius]